jgi:hypothetical protein
MGNGNEGAHKSPYAGQGINRSFYLPRLSREYYQANAVVHWTLPMAFRSTGWLTAAFHAHFRETMLHAAAREGFYCPVYCLMPDHLHLIWMGLRRDSDQRNGMKFLREFLGPALVPHHFQHQAHDHVLRDHERQRQAFSRVCFYILDNPRRAELVKHPKDWPYAGTVVPGYPDLDPLTAEFWPLFWKFYAAACAPDASHIKRA